jgi:predicted 3-demethylubiquinone-9 3-methyltransferase (glyoxalase superfamily)
MTSMIPCIAFTDNAEEAASLYVALFQAVFGNSGEIARSHFTQAEIDTVRDIHGLPPVQLPGPAGAVKVIRFQLNGQEILALNGGGYFGKFHECHSLYVPCQTQAQIDRLWNVLAEDGQEQPCGWVKDRFGISWQIVPDFVQAVDEQGGRAGEQMNIALLGMSKADVAILRQASEL